MKCDRSFGKESTSRPRTQLPERRANMGPLLRLDSTGEASPSYHHVPNGARTSQKQEETKSRFSNCMDKVLSHLQRSSIPSSVNSFAAVSQETWSVKDFWPVKSDTCGMKSGALMGSRQECCPFVGMSPPPKANERFECLKPASDNKCLSRKLIGTFPCGISSRFNSRYNSSHMSHLRNSRWSSLKDSSIPYHCQQRNVQCSQKDHAEEVDPSLKPYNARLLQKSKMMHDEKIKSNCAMFSFLSKSEACGEESEPKQTAASTPEKLQVSQECQEESVSAQTMDLENERETLCASASNQDIKPQASTEVSSEIECEGNCDKTDWFEYRAESEVTVDCEKALITPESVSEVNKSLTVSDDKVSDSKSDSVSSVITIPRPVCERSESVSSASGLSSSPPLLSWLSVESETSENVGETDEKCDKTQDAAVKSVKSESLSGGSKKQSCTQSLNVKIRHIDLQSEKNSQKSDDTHPHKDLSFQLYLRNCSNKKSRPSSRKRRRHKAKLEESADKKQEKSSTGQECQPFSFLVGAASQSFVVSFSDDEDFSSDWSEDEGPSDSAETDSPLTSLDEECLGMFSNFNPMNFQVFCSFSSPTSTTSGALDAINLQWEVNVSVDKPSAKKKQSSKRVTFADDKSLITVHPMIAWSFAYQAARKGPWEEYVRDRERFLRRIATSEELLQPILDKTHRTAIYKERFADEL